MVYTVLLTCLVKSRREEVFIAVRAPKRMRCQDRRSQRRRGRSSLTASLPARHCIWTAPTDTTTPLRQPYHHVPSKSRSGARQTCHCKPDGRPLSAYFHHLRRPPYALLLSMATCFVGRSLTSSNRQGRTRDRRDAFQASTPHHTSGRDQGLWRPHGSRRGTRYHPHRSRTSHRSRAIGDLGKDAGG